MNTDLFPEYQIATGPSTAEVALASVDKAILEARNTAELSEQERLTDTSGTVTRTQIAQFWHKRHSELVAYRQMLVEQYTENGWL